MARLNGTKDSEKQKIYDDIMERAKAECVLTDKLYAILMEYQERYHDTKREPLKKSEKVGDLNLELSRLYNQIWTVLIGLNNKYRPKKKQKQMEVNA